MAMLQISRLTFGYEGGVENIFENVNLILDTTWRLGLIGRNGKGKTTFLKLLMGEMAYQGQIDAPVLFDYFPFEVQAAPNQVALEVMRQVIAPYARMEREMQACLEDGGEQAMEAYGALLTRYMALDGYTLPDTLRVEAAKLGVKLEALERPWSTLSHGEQMKLELAALFQKKNRFLLIDEPTNHLDADGREKVARYLKGKTGFILVSHDRYFLDQTIDHVLVLGRKDIVLQQGNYSNWQTDKALQDQAQLARNEKLKKDIGALAASARRTAGWSDAVERSKSGAADKGYVGHRAAKMMKRAKAIEARREKAIEEKNGLLQNLDEAQALKVQVLPTRRSALLEVRDLAIDYGGGPLFEPVSFCVREGERVAIQGGNGSGKSSILKLLLGGQIPYTGSVHVAGDLVIATVPQESELLQGSLRAYARATQIDESLFLTILRKLDFSRLQFDKDMADFSAGQKKKVLLAASLAKPAHLLIWDEPLNYIDILSRSQLEEAILRDRPAMVFVEHDLLFTQRVATHTVRLR